MILKTRFNQFSFIFVILELKFSLSVAQMGHETKHKLLKKCCTLGTMLHIRGLHIGCNQCIIFQRNNNLLSLYLILLFLILAQIRYFYKKKYYYTTFTSYLKSASTF